MARLLLQRHFLFQGRQTLRVAHLFADPLLNDIARRYGRTAAQIALRYQLQNGIMVIPKTAHRDRMEENLNVFDFVIQEDDMRLIRTLDQGRSLFNWYGDDWM